MNDTADKKSDMDVVIDTDTFNEIDDQYALAYLLRSTGQINVKAVYAAPFLNEKVESIETGIEKSTDEIKKIIHLTGRDANAPAVLRGATQFLKDEHTPAVSDAAENMVAQALRHTKENPLYVLGIAAATDIATALLLEPQIAERMIVIWLGGSAREYEKWEEFNFIEDIAAARVLFASPVRLIQVPCWGVAEHFCISRPELEYWLSGKNPLSDYLASITIREAEGYCAGLPWVKTIWDVTAAGWLINRNNLFMESRITDRPYIGYDRDCSWTKNSMKMEYVYRVNREHLFKDLFHKLTSDTISFEEIGDIIDTESLAHFYQKGYT